MTLQIGRGHHRGAVVLRFDQQQQLAGTAGLLTPALHQLVAEGIEAEAVVEAAEGDQPGIDAIRAEILQAAIQLSVSRAAEQIGLVKHVGGGRLHWEIGSASGPGGARQRQATDQERCTDQCGPQTSSKHVPHECR